MSLSRRRFLKQTFGFSAAALLGPGAARMLAAAQQSQPLDSAACHVLAVGDFGVKKTDLARQKAVGDAMARYVGQNKLGVQALELLGDNFYGGLSGQGVTSPRWEMNVEGIYPPSVFPCPMYAMLGNHDYDDEPKGACVAAQLAYRQHVPRSRWVMPQKWYGFDLPEREPLAKCLVLDTNHVDGNEKLPGKDGPQSQLEWLTAELAKPRTTPFLFVLGHHPVFSDGTHGDTKELVKDVEPLLRKHKVDLYLSGHDHDLQHLEFEGHPTSFVVSGGGGARAREVGARKRGPFGQAVYGFSHLELRRDQFTLRHIDANGNRVHTFSKSLDGKVSIG